MEIQIRILDMQLDVDSAGELFKALGEVNVMDFAMEWLGEILAALSTSQVLQAGVVLMVGAAVLTAVSGILDVLAYIVGLGAGLLLLIGLVRMFAPELLPLVVLCV